MKKVIFASVLLAGISIFSACNNSGQHDGANTPGTSDTGSTLNSGSSNGTTSGTDTMGNHTIGNSSTVTDTTNTMNGNTNNTLDKSSTDFITKAASGGMMEVELGNMAAQKAQHQRVKNFGSMMVTDHTKANNELKSIASSKGVTIPAAMLPEHQHHLDMMRDKSGNDFDKAYMKMMVDDHKKDVSEFKKASGSAKDAGVKDFATKTLPVLQKHLDSAKAINAKM